MEGGRAGRPSGIAAVLAAIDRAGSGDPAAPRRLGDAVVDGEMLQLRPIVRSGRWQPVRQTGQARALFLFRRAGELDDEHRDLAQQKRLLRAAFAEQAGQVPRLLAELEHATDFYFDSVSQIRMGSWSSGRVTLVGDRGYSPGPAVGGGTSIAVVGAYVLAGELRAAGGDHTTAFGNYEHEMLEFVRRSRSIGPTVMKSIIPRTPLQVGLTTRLMRLLPRLPATLRRGLSWSQGRPARALGSITLKDYEPTR
jgi:2-polyprenyl-6-methoxyphenol hydroxylase-like FAD-dependent oxidoreductase